MITVGKYLEQKGRQVWSVSPDATVYEALEVMAEKNIGAVLVMEEGQPVGIFSERDYARKVVLRGRSTRETPVSEVMTEKVLGVSPERTIDDCMALFTEKHIRHLPVVKDDQVVGVISIGDVVKSIISHQEYVIDQLEDYITGGR
jgi:CBS domain-containing protein